MSELLNVASQTRRAFQRHFLAVVHVEIAFAEIGARRVLDNRNVIESALKPLGFIESKQVNMSEMSIESQPDEVVKLSQHAQPVGLQFSDPVTRREIQVQRDRLILTDRTYDGFEKFLERLRGCFDAIAPILGLNEDSVCTRVGMRKVDSVVVEPISSLSDALSAFHPSLFSLARSGLPKEEAFRISEEVSVLEHDTNVCFLRTRLQRKTENSLEANLDFDFVTTRVQQFSDVFSETLPVLNQAHFDLFLWSVTPDLISIMEKE